MVGVVKQKKKATGEMIEYSIEFGRKITSEGLEQQEIQQFRGLARGGRGGAVRENAYR